MLGNVLFRRRDRTRNLRYISGRQRNVCRTNAMHVGRRRDKAALTVRFARGEMLAAHFFAEPALEVAVPGVI
eukprot:SAG31_NODE_2024_length_6644_cov_7.943621_10_plen_72_part_00